jgi:hypothetical protein
MRTKVSVWEAVLGTAPGLLPVMAVLWALPAQPRKEESKEEPVRPEGRRVEGPVPGMPVPGVPASVEPEVPVHPCELITVMKVPCEAGSATCEYTYWECPRSVKPLRA